ncbi:hypothetical protein C8Q76DRAFT_748987 [Earliella scabrosa]|nr:hypothetical protein C8Q76DRAFT_748987 [Earliella scabrosa]
MLLSESKQCLISSPSGAATNYRMTVSKFCSNTMRAAKPSGRGASHWWIYHRQQVCRI